MWLNVETAARFVGKHKKNTQAIFMLNAKTYVLLNGFTMEMKILLCVCVFFIEFFEVNAITGSR